MQGYVSFFSFINVSILELVEFAPDLFTVVYMCCCSSLTGDLPSAVWPAGFTVVYVCCCSSLTGDLPNVVWPAGFAVVYVCCCSSLTGDLPKSLYIIVSLSCSCRLSRSIFSRIHAMATGEHCLVIFVDLLQKLENYVYNYNDVCTKILFGITYEEM